MDRKEKAEQEAKKVLTFAKVGIVASVIAFFAGIIHSIWPKKDKDLNIVYSWQLVSGGLIITLDAIKDDAYITVGDKNVAVKTITFLLAKSDRAYRYEPETGEMIELKKEPKNEA